MRTAPESAVAKASGLLFVGLFGGTVLLFATSVAGLLPSAVEWISYHRPSVSSNDAVLFLALVSGLAGVGLLMPALLEEGSFRQRLARALTRAANGTGCLGSFFFFSLLWTVLLAGPGILIFWTLHPGEWRRLIKLMLFIVSTITALFYMWLRQDQFNDVKDVALFFGGWVAYPNFFADMLL